MTTDKTVKLSAAQRRFLHFHAEAPWPHKWAWLDAGGMIAALEPPVQIRAWKRQNEKTRQCSCSREDFHVLREMKLMDCFRLTDAGRAILNGEKTND